MRRKDYEDLLRRILQIDRRGGGVAVGGGSAGITALTGDGSATGPGSAALTIANDAITNAKLADMAAHLIKARKTNSTGDPEDCTLSEILDFIGSAAQGDVLYRGASGWARLPAGTSGQFLKTNGASANPAWATVTGGGGGGVIAASGFYLDDGSQKYAPVFAMTPPVDGDFAWVNQGGATITSVNGALRLTAPATGSDNVRIRKEAFTSGQTVTAAWMPDLYAKNFLQVGITLRESGSGKLINFCLFAETAGFGFGQMLWNSVTSFSSGPLLLRDIGAARYPLIWMRVADNGTNRIWSYSVDGATWVQLLSESRTTFLTADEAGFFANTTTTLADAGMTLLHWTKT